MVTVAVLGQGERAAAKSRTERTGVQRCRDCGAHELGGQAALPSQRHRRLDAHTAKLRSKSVGHVEGDRTARDEFEPVAVRAGDLHIKARRHADQ